MAEPTMKDVLDVITQMRGELAKLDAKVDTHRAETAAHRAETAKGLADLDRDLTKHMDVHREI